MTQRIEVGQWRYSNSDNMRIIMITDVDMVNDKVHGFNTKTHRSFVGALRRFGTKRKNGFTLVGGKEK